MSDEGRAGGGRRIWIFRGLGLAAALLVWGALYGAEGLSADGRMVAAIGALMAVWWTTEAVPLSVTSLLPIVLLPAGTERTVKAATAAYGSSIVFLFLGGFLLAIAMERHELHRRIALHVLDRVGVSPRRIVLGMMVATGFLSMWVSNTATTLMMLPIGLSVLGLVVERAHGKGTAEELEAKLEEGTIAEAVDDPQVRAFGICMTLAIAWSASMGGLGTLLGSPPNAIVAGYARDELGIDIGFLEWMAVGVPLAATFIVLAWLLMTRVLYRFTLSDIPGGRKMIREQIDALGPMGRAEKSVALVFGGAAALWVLPGLLSGIPGLSGIDIFDDTAIAIGAGVALFFLTDAEGAPLLDWKVAEAQLPWGVLLLFGGGLSLAGSVASTGLDAWFGSQVAGLGALPLSLLVASVVAIILFLTEVTSNTATAATFIPVLGGVAAGIDVAPLTLLVPAAFAATCAFMLPVGTPPNAIVYGTGNVTIAQMVRGGLVLNLLGVVLITAAFLTVGSLVFGA